MFIGHEKLYEAHIGEKKAETREKVEKVLKRALQD